MDKLIKRLPPPVLNRLQRWQANLANHWGRLNAFQRYYFLALVSIPINTSLAALLAIAGLILDFWPRFVRAWKSLAGKAIILLFYAVVANFAYVSAAGLINELTGVNADFLPYSLNTALLLKLPAFAISISVVALLLVGLIFPAYLIALLLLRWLGVSSQHLFRRIEFPVATLCVRFVLCWLLVMQLGDLLSDEEAAGDAQAANPPAQAGAKTGAAPAQTTLQANADLSTIALNNSGYEHNISKLLSQFIYYLEAAEKSRCALAKGERAIELNDYQYLAITKEESAEYGLRYTVKACVSPGITLPQTGPSPQQ